METQFKKETIMETNSLTEKLENLRDMKAEIAPMLAEMAQIEKEIKHEILETGELPDVDGVKVSIRNGYKKSTWDNKMLTGYSLLNPEILKARKESEIGPSVALSFRA